MRASWYNSVTTNIQDGVRIRQSFLISCVKRSEQWFNVREYDPLCTKDAATTIIYTFDKSVAKMQSDLNKVKFKLEKYKGENAILKMQNEFEAMHA